MQLEHSPDHRESTKRGVLPLTEMARELGERGPLIGRNVERRITRAIPAVVSDSSSKARIKNVERGVRGDMSIADAGPWANLPFERRQLGTPSYVEASSAKTVSICPRSISCKAVRPPNTGSGVAINCAKPSGV